MLKLVKDVKKYKYVVDTVLKKCTINIRRNIWLFNSLFNH